MSAGEESDWERGSDDAIAAEYVLGALDAGERRAAAARIGSDPEFARLVERWEARLAPMAAGYPEVAPPDSVKQALDARLFAGRHAASARPPLWSRLSFWQALAAAAIISHLLYVVIPYILPPPDPAGEQLVASIDPQGSEVRYVAVYDADSGEVALSHVSGERTEGRDFELWMIEGDSPPVSLGVIPEGAAVRVPLDEAEAEKLAAGAVLAVSLEPQGGSPTGAPTGPVVAAGDLREI